MKFIRRNYSECLKSGQVQILDTLKCQVPFIWNPDIWNPKFCAKLDHFMYVHIRKIFITRSSLAQKRGCMTNLSSDFGHFSTNLLAKLLPVFGAFQILSARISYIHCTYFYSCLNSIFSNHIISLLNWAKVD